MQGRTVITFIVVASLMMVGAVGSASAHPNVGVSGNCEDGDTETTENRIQISQENQDLLTPEEVQATVTELSRFGQAVADDPQGENHCDGAENDDYIEAHAGAQGQGIQACYSDANDQSSPSQENLNVAHTDGGYCE